MNFESFGKITRLTNAHAVITEKVDGTNACIAFDDEGNMTCQSSKRIINQVDDNFGFATWASANEQDLWDYFGPGRHFGEWFGCGIQRGYQMLVRQFAPFNTHLFGQEKWAGGAPDGVTYLPVLWKGPFGDLTPNLVTAMESLAEHGSETDFGHGYPAEGAMVWISGLGYLKVPFDETHKYQQEAVAA